MLEVTSEAHPSSIHEGAAGARNKQDVEWFDIDGVVEWLNRGLETGDVKEWGPAMGELVNPMYRREEAIEVLAPVLAHSSWAIRTTAAHLLLMLGSAQGVPVLQSALEAAARGEDVPEEVVVRAAASLHEFRQRTDGSAVFDAYERYKNWELLDIAMAQHAPQLTEWVREQRSGSVYVGGLLRMNEPNVIEGARRYIESSSLQWQEIGHWTLYRISGDEEHLAFIINKAKQNIGLLPGPPDENPYDSESATTLRLLQMTVTPEVETTLREIADFLVETSSRNQGAFSKTFAALFYLHEDYGFVDERVLSYLRGDYEAPAISDDLMWHIAEARRTPEIEAAAIARSPITYERHFIRLSERPLEGWISGYFRNLPIDILPAVETKDGSE
ncbi:MAG: HEAT repeat domain-containing protein [Opitutaceae bacterium]